MRWIILTNASRSACQFTPITIDGTFLSVSDGAEIITCFAPAAEGAVPLPLSCGELSRGLDHQVNVEILHREDARVLFRKKTFICRSLM